MEVKGKVAYLVALYSVEKIGPKRLRMLLARFGDPKKVWKAGEKELEKVGLPSDALSALLSRRRELDPERFLESISRRKIKVLTWEDEEYPSLLRKILNPPPVLFVKGTLQRKDERSLAVIGTRTPSFYGRQVTELLVKDLVSFGFTIVSGMARGIDSLVHKTALENGGRTIAVLGCGVGICYPPENRDLMEEIIQKGAVISHFFPDKNPSAGLFPARNRIIAGLSLGVLVTEAAHKSGTKITAQFAQSQGKPVFAVPGPITSKLAKGTNELIQMGAKLVNSAEDVLRELGMEVRKGKREMGRRGVQPESKEEEALLKLLGPIPIHIDDLVRESGLSASVVGSTLSLMEIKGKVKNVGNKRYVLS